MSEFDYEQTQALQCFANFLLNGGKVKMINIFGKDSFFQLKQHKHTLFKPIEGPYAENKPAKKGTRK
jgi:hypothetical protein